MPFIRATISSLHRHMVAARRLNRRVVPVVEARGLTRLPRLDSRIQPLLSDRPRTFPFWNSRIHTFTFTSRYCSANVCWGLADAPQRTLMHRAASPTGAGRTPTGSAPPLTQGTWGRHSGLRNVIHPSFTCVRASYSRKVWHRLELACVPWTLPLPLPSPSPRSSLQPTLKPSFSNQHSVRLECDVTSTKQKAEALSNVYYLAVCGATSGERNRGD